MIKRLHSLYSNISVFLLEYICLSFLGKQKQTKHVTDYIILPFMTKNIREGVFNLV